MPYAEPTYLSKGFHSPYYTEVRCTPRRARFWFAQWSSFSFFHFLFFLMFFGALIIVWERNLLWGWWK